MINYEACRKGGLARVKSKCRVCGQFMKPTSIDFMGTNIHLACQVKRAAQWESLSVRPWRSMTIEGLHFEAGEIMNASLPDFKTGDVWDPKASEKEAVRKYAQERDELETLGRSDDKRVFLTVLAVSSVLCAFIGYGVGFVVWGMR